MAIKKDASYTHLFLMISNLNSDTSQLFQHFIRNNHKKKNLSLVFLFVKEFYLLERVKKRNTPETGAALFNNPTSSSNSDANTDEGNLIPVVLKKKLQNG